MFYGNEVVKFRDVALRGPWTSGGFEYNYGVIGHSPACSFPVDYLIRTNADGSISCIVSTLDLLTRTYWSVEINLPKDKAWFTTHSFWHNKTGASKPYYHWINTGVKSTDDLQFIYDGTHYIGHEGVPYPWPMDSARNKTCHIWLKTILGDQNHIMLLGSTARTLVLTGKMKILAFCNIQS